MASTITQYSNLININYPIPGVNNDTQGFRSNFSRIQSAFSRAGDEISELQKNSINLSSTNDFGNNIIKRAALQNSSQVINNLGIVSSTINIDYSLGSYQQITVESGPYNIIVNNWPPSGQVGTLRLEIQPLSSDPISINFVGDAYILTKTSLPITYAQNTPIVWELWSPDNGNSIYAHELGNINSVVTASNIIAFNSVSVNQNKFTVKPITSATIVETGNYAQELALLPHIVPATLERYGCGDQDPSTSTFITVSDDSDLKNIRPGSILWLNNNKHTVTDIIGKNVYLSPWYNLQTLSSNVPLNSTIEFINLKYNQPSTLHLVSREPITTIGRPYDLKGQVYADGGKFWVAYRDHETNTNQWLKVATQTGRNIFTQINTFTHITNFKAPIVLASYTKEQADALIPITNTGTMIFITSDVNKPAYFYNGAWRYIGESTIATPTGDLVIEPGGIAIWDVLFSEAGQTLNFSLPGGLNFDPNNSNFTI